MSDAFSTEIVPSVVDNLSGNQDNHPFDKVVLITEITSIGRKCKDLEGNRFTSILKINVPFFLNYHRANGQKQFTRDCISVR